MAALTIAARRLFSQFKTDSTVDPKTYVVAVIELFSHYSDDTVMDITHPFTGMASRQNWLPTLHEIRQACDKASGPLPSIKDVIAETLARRKEEAAEKGPMEERIAHVARLKEAGGLTFDPIADLNRGWWETLTLTDALTALARYEREAQQEQSLAAELDPFEDEPMPSFGITVAGNRGGAGYVPDDEDPFEW